MMTVLLGVVFTLCLLAWIMLLAAFVVFAFLVAAEAMRILKRALCNISHRAAARARFRLSDHRFLRGLGIKHR